MLGTTVDQLLSGEEEKKVKMLPEAQRKNFDDMMFRVMVNSADGDKVRVNLPMPLLKVGLELGMTMPEVSNNKALKGVDFEQIIKLVERGVIGKLVEVESAEGDIVEIVVE